MIIPQELSAKIYILLWLLRCFDRSNSIRCRHCRQLPLDGGPNCYENCHGDFCFVYSSHDRHFIQGCYVGHLEASQGCRVNSANATLCICQKDLCNDLHNGIIKFGLTFPLPLLRCQKFMQFKSFYRQRDSTSCQSNICSYSLNLTAADEAKSSLKNLLSLELPTRPAKIVGCPAKPEYVFDVDILGSEQSVIGARPGVSYVLQFTNSDEILRFNCETGDLCNARGPLSPTIKPDQAVNCFLGHMTKYDRIDGNKTCYGEFCIIQRFSVLPGRQSYSRGCVTSSKALAIRTGVSRTFGVTQWICGLNGCNRNVEAAERSLASHDKERHLKLQDNLIGKRATSTR